MSGGDGADETPVSSQIHSDIIQRHENRRIGALILIVATFLSIGLGNSWHPTGVDNTWGARVAMLGFYGIWSGIFAVASVPVVVLSLYGQRFRRTLIMAFIPPVVVGTGTQLVWHNPLALLAAPVSLWLMCLITALTSPDRRARLVANQGRCGACGYDLTGNVSGACPECGEAVGPVTTGGAWWWAVARTLLLWLVGAAVGLGRFGFLFYKMLSQPI